jgi:hypothetical protein
MRRVCIVSDNRDSDIYMYVLRMYIKWDECGTRDSDMSWLVKMEIGGGLSVAILNTVILVSAGMMVTVGENEVRVKEGQRRERLREGDRRRRYILGGVSISVIFILVQ